MFTPRLLSIKTSRFSSPAITGASFAAAMFGVIIATGCGGGGGGGTTNPPASPTPTPVASVTPTPTPSPTPSPVPSPLVGASTPDISRAKNFLPNYVPTNPDRLLRWGNNKNLRVWVRPTVVNVITDAPSGTIDAGRARRLVEQALAIWSAATTNDFTFVIVDTKENADIEIGFCDELRRVNGEVVNGIGITDFAYRFPNASDSIRAILDKANVQVKTGFPDDNLVDTTAHEIGHALGIEEHSANERDLLFTVSFPPAISTERDQNTAFFLYYSPEALGGRSVKINPSAKLHTDEVVCEPRR